MVFGIAVFIILAIIVLRWPYLGIVIAIASLPLIEILPQISEASSLVSLLGAVTFAAFFLTNLKRKASQKTSIKLLSALMFGFLFLLWLLTNSTAAVTPAPDGRVWIFTFLQLWALSWLTFMLIETPDQVQVLMWGFFLAGLVSAIYASGEGIIGVTVKTSTRATGLAEGANSAARYFLIALMFAYVLLTQQKKRIIQLFLLVGMAVVLYGVVVTVSRTGLLLLIAGISLLLLQNIGTRNRVYAFILAFSALGIVWVFADNITFILQSISGSVLAGTDTVGIRYRLWLAGLRMWIDNPIFGVGVGQFNAQLSFYAWDLLQPRYLALGAHNMYIAVLSETGLIGLVFFLAMFVTSFRYLFIASRSSVPQVKELALNWTVILILILIAGITKHDQYDKLVWMFVGISAAIGRMDYKKDE